MARASSGALRPNNEAPRQTGRTVQRGTTNYFNISSNEDSKSALRLQRLSVLGVVGTRADLIAGLAWGVVNG